MPLPIRKLEESNRPLTDRIMDALEKADRANGYNELDIFCAVEEIEPRSGALYILAATAGSLRGDALAPYRRALADLVQRGRLRQLMHNGVAFFAVTAR